MNPCKFCGQPTKNKAFCSMSCNGKYATTTPEGREKFYTKERARKISASKLLMHKDHPEYANRFRQRQLKNNTASPVAVREKISRSLLAIGHAPPIRRGNGWGPTKPEKILLDKFPEAKNNFPVKTGALSGSGFPACYKVDVAFPNIRLAVEVDGQSHRSPLGRERDNKRDRCLMGLGWNVLRFTNKAILTRPEEVMRTISSIISLSTDIRVTASMDS